MARKRRSIAPVIVEVVEEEVEEVGEEQHPTTDSSDRDDGGNENHEDEDDDDEDDDDEEEDEDGEDEDDDEELEEEDEDEKPKQREDGDEDYSSKESIIKLLEPFGKDQLIEIFKGGAVTNPAILSRVVGAADTDPIHRNIFVHGLSWDVTTETLSAAFSCFGKIDSCTAVSDHATGRCKGYGFVLFHSRAAAQSALKDPVKKIGNRMVSCQLASLGNPAASKKFKPEGFSEATGRKIYVNNVGNNIKPESLLAFFSKFGEIEGGPFGFDPVSGKFRGYALFYYKTVEGCNKALEEPVKFFEGCKMQCQRALPGSNKKHDDLNQYAVQTESISVGLQANDRALNYASAAPLMGQNLVPGSAIGQSGGGVGLFNPAFNGVTAIPQMPYAVGTVGSTNRGSGIGINSVNPSVITNYGSLAALQGLGAYNSTPGATIRPSSEIGSYGASGLPAFRY